MQEYEAQMDEYKRTENWRKYQIYLNDFKAQQAQSQSSSTKRPSNSRSTTDSSNNTRVSRGSPTSSVGSPTTAPSTFSASTEAESCHNALILAFSELVGLRSEILDPSAQPYNKVNLPPRELTQRAIYAFIEGTGSLLFMWSREQADEMLDRVYRSQPVSEAADAMNIAECFVVAAMGAHYDMECFPERIRKLLYASGTLYFHEHMVRQDYLRSMRLLLCMSFYSLLEKHMSARYLIGKLPPDQDWKVGTNSFTAAGLQIGRRKGASSLASSCLVVQENWTKLFRSLIFMDSWLAYTLGYVSEVTPSDVQV